MRLARDYPEDWEDRLDAMLDEADRLRDEAREGSAADIAPPSLAEHARVQDGMARADDLAERWRD